MDSDTGVNESLLPLRLRTTVTMAFPGISVASGHVSVAKYFSAVHHVSAYPELLYGFFYAEPRHNTANIVCQSYLYHTTYNEYNQCSANLGKSSEVPNRYSAL